MRKQTPRTKVLVDPVDGRVSEDVCFPARFFDGALDQLRLPTLEVA